MQRREFLKGAAGLAGVGFIGCTSVPERPLRGGVPMDLKLEEKLQFKRLEIRAGATKPFRALHISDTHLTGMNSRDLETADAERLWLYEKRKAHFPDAEYNFAASVAYAKRERIPILHTGDLIDYVSESVVAKSEAGLKGTDTVAAAGNHEYNWYQRQRPIDADISKEKALVEPHFPNRFDDYSRVINGVNFVVFDNTNYNVSEAQVKTLNAEFDKGLPTVLMCHVPFYTPEIYRWMYDSYSAWKLWRWQTGHVTYLMGCSDEEISDYSEANFAGQRSTALTREFIRSCQARKNLKAILCGHLHLEWIGDFSATAKQYVVGPNYAGAGFDITFI